MEEGRRSVTGETPFLGLVEVVEVYSADFVGIESTAWVRTKVAKRG